MEQNGCVVTNAKENNIKLGSKMHHMEKEENVPNLIDWLNSEASLRSQKGVGKDADFCETQAFTAFQENLTIVP